MMNTEIYTYICLLRAQNRVVNIVYRNMQPHVYEVTINTMLIQEGFSFPVLNKITYIIIGININRKPRLNLNLGQILSF